MGALALCRTCNGWPEPKLKNEPAANNPNIYLSKN
jgi:hypothetical protein